MCASTKLWLMSGGTQGTFPDETRVNLRYLRNRTGAALRDNGQASNNVSKH